MSEEERFQRKLKTRGSDADLVQDEDDVAAGLLAVPELGRGCAKETVTLCVPLWTHSQSKSSEIFLRERGRGREHELQTNSGGSTECSFLDDATSSNERKKKKKERKTERKNLTFNKSSSTFTPFADKELQRSWACLDSSGSEDRGKSKLLQHPSNSSISFNSL